MVVPLIVHMSKHYFISLLYIQARILLLIFFKNKQKNHVSELKNDVNANHVISYFTPSTVELITNISLKNALNAYS